MHGQYNIVQTKQDIVTYALIFASRTPAVIMSFLNQSLYGKTQGYCATWVTVGMFGGFSFSESGAVCNRFHLNDSLSRVLGFNLPSPREESRFDNQSGPISWHWAQNSASMNCNVKHTVFAIFMRSIVVVVAFS